MTQRCQWCGDDPLYQHYHDQEWGTPLYDDQTLFEFIHLEGVQAGLAWITVLRKRKDYRRRFDNFDPQIIARYSDKKLEKLLLDPAIIRNRLKVLSARKNARAFLTVQENEGSFSKYLWDFLGGQPLQNHWESEADIPASTPLSEQISKDLKKRGFNFVGPTIIYAFMQATGMVNDHVVGCFRHKQCQELIPSSC